MRPRKPGTTVHLRLSPEAHTRLRIFSAVQDRDWSDVASELLIRYLPDYQLGDQVRRDDQAQLPQIEPKKPRGKTGPRPAPPLVETSGEVSFTYDQLKAALHERGLRLRELEVHLGLKNLSVFGSGKARVKVPGGAIPPRWWPGIRVWLEERGWTPHAEQPTLIL